MLQRFQEFSLPFVAGLIGSNLLSVMSRVGDKRYFLLLGVAFALVGAIAKVAPENRIIWCLAAGIAVGAIFGFLG